MECSAKNNCNIREIMKQFLSLAKINIPNVEIGLRRRSSAHASSVSKFRLNNLASKSITPHIIPELIIDALTNPHGSEDHPIRQHLNGHGKFSPSQSPKHLTTFDSNNQNNDSNLNSNNSNASNSNTNISADESNTNNGLTIGLSQRLKPRSRSLIRRSSKKVNKVKDPNSEPDDCYMQ